MKKKLLFMETTKIDPLATVSQIQAVLGSYGAGAIMTQYDKGEVMAVSFQIEVNGRRRKMITLKWLDEQRACGDGVDWFKAQKETDGLKVVKKLIKEKKLDWANWLIVRIMSYKQYVSYAVYAAEQVINIYEKKYPDNKRPRKAIEAAKKCIKDRSVKNKNAAYAAAYAAANAAAYAAAYAAATATAAYAAYAAANAAANAAMRLKILKYGIKLLGEK